MPVFSQRTAKDVSSAREDAPRKSDHVRDVALYADARPFQELAFLFFSLSIFFPLPLPFIFFSPSRTSSPPRLAEHGAQTFYCLLMAALSIIRDQSLRANEPGTTAEEIAGNKKQKKVEI